MFAYKEIITLDNPQQLNLKTPLPFLKGKKVEVLVIVEDETEEDETEEDETDYILNNKSIMQQITLSEKTHQQKTGYQPTEEELNAIVSI